MADRAPIWSGLDLSSTPDRVACRLIGPAPSIAPDLLPAAEAMLATIDLIERYDHALPPIEVLALLTADRARLDRAVQATRA